MSRNIGLLIAALVVACGDNDRRQPATDSARGDVATGADSGMAGMDHSKMPGMADSAATGMEGMDHSKMPDMTAPAPGGGSMAGMDHSKMPGMGTAPASPGRPVRPMAGMDHSNMPGMGAASGSRRRPANPMAGMDHANMPGMVPPSRAATPSTPPMDHSNMPGMTGAMSTPATAAELKLDTLVAALLNDPIVRQRIQSDSSLKRRWDNAARQTILLTRPQ